MGITLTGYSGPLSSTFIIPHALSELNSFEKITEIKNTLFYQAKFNRLLTTLEGSYIENLNGGFGNCSNLINISFPKCKFISDGNIFNNTRFENEIVPSLLSQSDYITIGSVLYKGASNLSSTAIINSAINYICGGVFRSNSTITALSCLKCASVGSQAFWACSNLADVNLPNCTYISSHAFLNCSKLSNVVFPNCSYIAGGAFYLCSSIRSVNIPNCSYIGSGAFTSCGQLSQVNLSKCKYIGDSAFFWCSIEHLSLPECEYIGSAAFMHNFSLKTVYAPKCSKIDTLAFYGCSNLSSVYIPNCKEFGYIPFVATKLSFSSSERIINNILIGVSNGVSLLSSPDVYGIATRAVNLNSGIISVSLPNCSKIGYGAFEYCSNLEYVNLPACKALDVMLGAFYSTAWERNLFSSSGIAVFNNVLYSASSTLVSGTVSLSNIEGIAIQAFLLCRSLTAATFPDCEYIGPSAFSLCSSLATISFPKCTYIDEAAFTWCYSSLTTIEFPVCSYIETAAFLGCFSLISASFPKCSYIGQIAFQSCSNLNLINFAECSYIGSSAFKECKSLTTASFPQCSYIDYEAFKSCYSLVEAVFPNCSYIANGAFYDCTKLETISIPVCSHIRIAAFRNCNVLKNISILNCTYIERSAFSACSVLASLNLPLCSIIESYAFARCFLLSTISIPSCNKLENGAFYYCPSLTAISLPNCTYIGELAFDLCSRLSSIFIPNCSHIGDGAFASALINNFTNINSSYFSFIDGCLIEKSTKTLLYCVSSLTTVNNDCKIIATKAFAPCYYLSSISLSECTTIKSSAFSRTRVVNISFPVCNYVGTEAFAGCDVLLSVSLPNCSYIGDSAFYSCSRVNNIYIPNCIHILGSAFRSCYSLSTIDLPNCIALGEYAFRSCILLTNINLLNCKLISDNAFDGCSALSNIALLNCEYIGGYAFYSCYSLDTITLHSLSITELYASTAFAYCSKLQSIYVPYRFMDIYKSAVNWSYFATKFVPTAFPINCKSLSITGDDCKGRATHTTIHVSATCDLQDITSGEIIENQPWSFDDLSDEFPQNPSTTETVQRTISYTYFDKTATCTITQGVYVPTSYSLELIGTYGFAIDSTIPNPDATLYEGVYKSDNYNIDNSQAVVKITFVGYDNFTVYIRSYAESTYDYTIASTLDAASYPTDYSSTTTKAHTRGNLESGTALSNYTKVTYETDENEHFIYIVYRKDSSAKFGDDRGYFLIEK